MEQKQQLNLSKKRFDLNELSQGQKLGINEKNKLNQTTSNSDSNTVDPTNISSIMNNLKYNVENNMSNDNQPSVKENVVENKTIIKSETDKKKMEVLGNIFTHYNYSTIDIFKSINDQKLTIKSNKSNFEIPTQLFRI